MALEGVKMNDSNNKLFNKGIRAALTQCIAKNGGTAKTQRHEFLNKLRDLCKTYGVIPFAVLVDSETDEEIDCPANSYISVGFQFEDQSEVSVDDDNYDYAVTTEFNDFGNDSGDEPIIVMGWPDDSQAPLKRSDYEKERNRQFKGDNHGD